MLSTFSTTRFFSKLKHYFVKADKWIVSPSGFKFRLGLATASIAIYPVGALILNGPMQGMTFRCRYSVEELPSFLKAITAEQYSNWLARESRNAKDAKANFSCQKDVEHGNFDSVALGSLGIRYGALIGLPFYTRFSNEDEAMEYCKKNLEPFKFFGKTVCIVWDSTLGRELLSTLVMSPAAISFLINRDLYENDGWDAYANKASSWVVYTLFSTLFTMFIYFHYFKQKGALTFAVLFSTIFGISVFALLQWHYLYKYGNSCRADCESASLSMEHCEGAKEYYWKMLKRNRILRQLVEDGDRVFSAAGNDRKAITNYMVRYETVNGIKPELMMSKKTDVINEDDNDDL